MGCFSLLSVQTETVRLPSGLRLISAFLPTNTLESWALQASMVGVCAQDMSGGGHHADFDYFTYRERV